MAIPCGGGLLHGLCDKQNPKSGRELHHGCSKYELDAVTAPADNGKRETGAVPGETYFKGCKIHGSIGADDRVERRGYRPGRPDRRFRTHPSAAASSIGEQTARRNYQ